MCMRDSTQSLWQSITHNCFGTELPDLVEVFLVPLVVLGFSTTAVEAPLRENSAAGANRVRGTATGL